MIISIGLVTSVSAADLNESDVVNEDADEISHKIAADDKLEVSNNSEVLKTEFNPVDFNEIQNSIDSANDGDTIVLNGNYVFTGTINVNKSLNVIGINNAVVDGNSKVRLFTVTNDGVVFKNITFKNGYSSEGSAIDGKCNAINCIFINNTVYGDGIYHYDPYAHYSFQHNGWGGAVCDVNVTSSSFINNTASNKGGAMYGGSAVNCSFSNNRVRGFEKYDYASRLNVFVGYGGAVYGSNILDCIFVENSAVQGGAVVGGNVVNSTFMSNNASDGGAIFIESEEFSFKNCNFKNNHATNGGALYYSFDVNSIQNHCFENNSASNEGNEIFINASNIYNNLNWVLTINNCTFIKCSSKDNSWYIGFTNRKNNRNNYLVFSKSKFINCSSNTNGGAICLVNVNSYSVEDCYFEGNSANNGGAIYYDVKISSLKNCKFKNNVAQYGGAIFYQNFNNIEDCSFDNNYALKEGNDIFINDSEEINILNCNFTNCHSMDNWFVGFNNAKSILISNCNFSNCSSKNKGGAIYLTNLNSFDITHSYFTNNFAGYSASVLFEEDVAVGGAIYLENLSKINITDCIFVHNNAGKGGAIYITDSYDCFISDSTFDNNFVFFALYEGYAARLNGEGGAIYTKNSNNTHINNSKFILNHASAGGSAGAIFGNVSVYNSVFSQNHVMGDGGAMYGGYAENCTFVKNYVSFSRGGAIYDGTAVECNFIGNGASSGGAIYDSAVINCTFKDNHANYRGGAVYDGFAINCNFENNAAEIGGAISFENNGTAYNCSFINNSASDVGGAININSDLDFNIENCKFINCSSVNGGAAINCAKANAVNVIACSFENCTSENGGRISNSADGMEMNILDCIFDETPEGVPFKYEPVLTVNNVSIVKGQKAVLMANLSDIRGPLAGKNITFTVNKNNYYNTTDSEGIAIFSIDEYLTDIGYYNVTVSFEGEEHVNPVSTYSNVFINSYKGTLTLSVDGKYYDDVTLTFKLFDCETNEAIHNASVKVEFDNTQFADLKTDENGIVNYKVPFAPGKYVATAYVSDGNVDVNSINTSFEINKIVGRVTVSQVDNNVLDIRLFNSNNGDVYRNINVTLKFDNMEPIYVVTNDRGIANYQMDFAPGSYSLVAMVSKQYTEIQNVLETIEIADPSNFYSKVTFSSGIVFDYASSGSIYVTVTGGSIDEENIKVLNHPEAKITLVKNVITISKLNPGTYTLFVGSIPSGDLKPGNGTVSVTVKKSIAVVKASKVTVALKSKAYWVIKIVDSKTNKPISNMKVTLKIYTGKKYKSVTRYTNSKGEVNYNTKGLSKGNHKVVVSASHKGYNLNTFTSSIKVIKQTSLKFKLREKHDDNGGSLRSFVVTNKKTKKGVNGVKIKVYIYTGKKVKTYTLKTKKIKGKKGTYNGAFGFSTNQFSAGKHKVVLKPVSIKYKGSITTSIKIKKKATKGPKYFRTL